jgi:cellulose synthase/poly-beta-1,6-N-acetylglucosamine synthase-like glycosyltransferase
MWKKKRIDVSLKEENNMTIGLSLKTETDFPLVTVGIVVLNREWIISKTLDSILHQTYPHNRIFVFIADGGSKDRTVETAREILQKSDFAGYDIISKESSIPEGKPVAFLG